MKAGDVVALTGGDLAFGGDAVARAEDGMTVFVPLLAPGDRARVRIERVWPNRARGRIVELEAPGPDRVVPPCPVFGECGGCQWQHVTLAAQRAAKERIVRRLLEPLLAPGASLGALEGEGEGYAYRNRLLLPVRSSGQGLRAGFFRARSHSLVEVADCAVQLPVLWETARAAVTAAAAAGVSGYDEAGDAGCLRHLLVRVAAGTGELGLVFVTAETQVPALDRAAADLMGRVPGLAGVVQNVNPGATNVILGPRSRLLAGRGHLTERIGGLELRAALTGFFQAHHAVTERMLARLRAWTAGERGGVLDLYGGVGLMGLAAATAPGAAPAWFALVEESPAAAEDAGANAASALPGVPADCRAGDVARMLPALGARLAGLGTVIVDPPRKGLDRAVLDLVAALPAARLVYVSCDPVTLARDAALLVAAGWRLAEAVPYDMFPQTHHVEVMARFSR